MPVSFLFHEFDEIRIVKSFDYDVRSELFVQLAFVIFAISETADAERAHFDACGDLASPVSDDEHVFTFCAEGGKEFFHYDVFR